MSTNIQHTHGDAVKAGMAAKAKTGVPTGPVPLGYRKVRKNGIVTVEIDEEVASLVREAFRLAALKRQSLRKILETLNANGMRSQRGSHLSATALWRILSNPFYCGTVTYSDQRSTGTHTPLVNHAQFTKAQNRLSIRRRH